MDQSMQLSSRMAADREMTRNGDDKDGRCAPTGPEWPISRPNRPFPPWWPSSGESRESGASRIGCGRDQGATRVPGAGSVGPRFIGRRATLRPRLLFRPEAGGWDAGGGGDERAVIGAEEWKRAVGNEPLVKRPLR